MFIKYLDFLSPRITFYHKGFLSHSSISSGILSIIAVIFVIILGIHFSLDIIRKINPKTFYLHSFVADAGIYQLNSSSLFHYISIIQIFEGKTIYEELDLEAFTIIGAQLYGNNFLNNAKYNGIESLDHWLYGYCNKEINTKGLDNLISDKMFNKSVCIKKYYNSTERQYYDIGDPKFSWPIIAHGSFNENYKLYGIYIQKCNNNTIKHILGNDYQCKNDLEIGNYFDVKGTRYFHLHFINNYINISNYENPYFNYFYRMETQLNKKQYTFHELYFNPTLVKTDDGLIINNIKENISYIFDRDNTYNFETGTRDIYVGFIFIIRNIRDIYERTYKRVQDVISSIGGINQAVTIVAICINTLYNNFVVLSDTELLLHSSIYNEKKNNKKELIKHRNSRNKIKDIEKKNIVNKKNSERKELSNESVINKSKINKSDNFSKSNYFINNYHTLNDKNQSINKNIIMDNQSVADKNYNNKENIKNNKKANNFLNFLCYIITCKNKAQNFSIYEKFRIKIISEEHIIKNHLNIYNLLKVTERKRYSRKSSYRLKDVINLV